MTFGYSVGHWEGDHTLVIDTYGMDENTWADRRGYPHSAGAHVIERYDAPRPQPSHLHRNDRRPRLLHAIFHHRQRRAPLVSRAGRPQPRGNSVHRRASLCPVAGHRVHEAPRQSRRRGLRHRQQTQNRQVGHPLQRSAAACRTLRPCCRGPEAQSRLLRVPGPPTRASQRERRLARSKSCVSLLGGRSKFKLTHTDFPHLFVCVLLSLHPYFRTGREPRSRLPL